MKTKRILQSLLLTSLLCTFAARAENGPPIEVKALEVKAVEARPASAPPQAAAPELNPSDYKLSDYRLGSGDAIRILVFQNPDMTLETRVNEGGSITYPLIGKVDVGGVTIAQAELNIASALRRGGFVQKPQVNIVLLQVRGNQVSVLGQVNRPGRYPLETFNTRVSELLAMAGGIVGSGGVVVGGADKVIVSGIREGRRFRKEVDVAELFLDNRIEDDFLVSSGDVIYVPPAPVYYIYGEAQRSGSYRIKRGMSVQQAMAEAGGPTYRGTERNLRVDRRGPDGTIASITPKPHEPVMPDDVLYVSESLF